MRKWRRFIPASPFRGLVPVRRGGLKSERKLGKARSAESLVALTAEDMVGRYSPQIRFLQCNLNRGERSDVKREVRALFTRAPAATMSGTSSTIMQKKGTAMLRTIAGVVVGYLVMFVAVFVLFTAAYLIMGAEAAFNPGTYDTSSAWLITSFILGTLAAVAGGYVCVRIAGKARAAWILAVVVLVLGLLSALPVLMAAGQPQEKRAGDVANLDSMMKARQPVWVVLASPVISAAGVLFGSRFRRSAWDGSGAG